MLISILVFVVIVLLSLPSAVIFIPLAVLTGRVAPLYWVGCWIARVGFGAAFIRIQVEGLETFPRDRASIVMANHVSNLDPPALIPRIPVRCSVFLKQELMKLPILGYGFKLGRFIPVARGGSPEQAKACVAAAVEVLRSGVSIATFPEGTRSRDGHMLPFKKGSFYLAKQTGALCVPVSIVGTDKLMAKGSFAIKPGRVRIVFHEPIDPAKFATREELIAAVRASIASSLPERMRD
jgi:1-acyl-sn-glycerol-3-phosphate acyltransferase